MEAADPTRKHSGEKSDPILDKNNESMIKEVKEKPNDDETMQEADKNEEADGKEIEIDVAVDEVDATENVVETKNLDITLEVSIQTDKSKKEGANETDKKATEENDK